MKFKNLIIIIALIFVYSCTGAKEALQGKKRSEQSDEFLVEKKNPLELPPDFDDLPVPLEQGEGEIIQVNNEQDIKNILELDTNEENSQETNNQSLEQFILEKIN
jgi:hypothetical protein